MYTTKEVARLQQDEAFVEEQENKYCLISLREEITLDDISNHCNFCILQILTAYKKTFIDKDTANFLIDSIYTIDCAKEHMDPKYIIQKLNKEIIVEALHTPFFNSMCVVCDDLYDSFRETNI